MKILVVSALYAPNEIGGAEITARAIAEVLVLQGHEVIVVSLAKDGKRASIEIGGVKVIYLPLANLFWLHGPEQRPIWQRLLWHMIDAYNPVMGHKIGSILDKEKPDVLHAHNLQGFSVATWRAAKNRNIPVVQTLHDYYFGCSNSTMYRDSRNCLRPCVTCRLLTTPKRWLSSIPDSVIAVSNRMLTRLEKRGLFNKIRHKKIIYGCNLIEPKVSIRPDKMPGERITLGFFGRVEPIKGLETLLETIVEINNPSITLLIGGRGKPSYVDPLKAKYESSRIKFMGFMTPADFFSQIDFLVVPSLWEEPLGRVIHEAFSYGVPSISSRLGGMPEMVVPGQTGYLFSAGDKKDLSTILQNLCQFGFPASFFFEKCLEQSEKYRLVTIVKQYSDTLFEAVENSKAAA